jgi:hypothetical protein
MDILPHLEGPLKAIGDFIRPKFWRHHPHAADVDRAPLFKELYHNYFNVFWGFLRYFIDVTWMTSTC